MSNSVTTSKRRLGDCLSFIVDNRGKTPPLSEHGIELIEINAIPGNRKSVDFDAIKKHVSQDTYNTWFRKGHPQVGDTLISTVGAIGRVAFVGKQRGCIAQNVIAMRPDVNLVDPGYLFYVLSSDAIQNRLNSLNIGVAQPSLKVPHLLNVELEFPDLPTQRKIADILSAYDDLIENNLRRIKILEEMTQSLYREWFVHFRFPGHEGVKMVDSPLGKIPEGWEVKRLGEIAENFDRKRKPISKTKRAEMQGIYPYYGAAKVFDYINDYIFEGEYLLMAEDGSVITPEQMPVLQLATGKFWANNHTHVLRGTVVSTHFLYLALSTFNVSAYITGAAQPKITQANMNRMPFFCGPPEIHTVFDSHVEPIVRMWQCLESRNQTLRETRDLLLPKLLSHDSR
jgi:type I restriction enzyme S subunit